MNDPRRVLFLLVFCLPVVAQTSGISVAQSSYNSLVQEYDSAVRDLQSALALAKTTEQKQKVFTEKHPNVGDFARRFMSLADRYPRDRSAVDALIWVILHPLPFSARESDLRRKALESLQVNYLGDERVGTLCTQLVFSLDPPSEQFLRIALQKSSLQGVQARACTSLAGNLKYRHRVLTQLKVNKEPIPSYEQALGKETVKEMLARDTEKLQRESESLFERVIKDHGAIKHPTHGTLAGLARANLAALRQPIAVGRPAPETEGEDFQSKRFKLSDYQGKVVLLDFWASVFPPCQAMYEYERNLVKRLADRPFALIGVNGDHNWPALKKILAAEQITWRSFWDGGNIGGPIATRWEVNLWPTLILIDQKGVVRAIYTGWPEPKVLDQAIDKLLDATKGS